MWPVVVRLFLSSFQALLPRSFLPPPFLMSPKISSLPPTRKRLASSLNWSFLPSFHHPLIIFNYQPNHTKFLSRQKFILIQTYEPANAMLPRRIFYFVCVVCPSFTKYTNLFSLCFFNGRTPVFKTRQGRDTQREKKHSI